MTTPSNVPTVPADPSPVREASHEFTFTVSVSSYGRGGDSHRMQIARALWTVLNRGFGADRVRVWANTPDKGTLRVLFIEDDDRISA